MTDTATRPELTHRELLVLRGTASGDSRAQLARRLGISERAVYKALLSLREKLNARTVEHIVARGFETRLLLVPSPRPLARAQGRPAGAAEWATPAVRDEPLTPKAGADAAAARRIARRIEAGR